MATNWANEAANRRTFLSIVGAVFFTTTGLFASELSRTPPLTEGPYYPDKLPLDTDNDLLIVSNSITPAVGEVTRLTGRILDSGGGPIKDATIEIWQVDNNGVYINTRDPKQSRRDKNFQGYGRFTSGSTGEYAFRTIKPVPYDNRCPHIHVKVKKGGQELVTTQIFVNGHPQNNHDMVLAGLRDPLDRELVLADFRPVPNSSVHELMATFDVVVGRTPDERDFQIKGKTKGLRS